MNVKNNNALPEKSTATIIRDSLSAVVEGVTGLAASSKSDLALSIGHVFQRLRGGEFLAVLLREWNQYREKGRVKDDYQETEQHKVCLQELFDFLDKDSPDEIRFSVLKKIFLVAATEERSSRDSLLPQQYMHIARTLSDGEVLVLNACYRAYKDKTNPHWQDDSNPSAVWWLGRITELSGLGYPELVETHETLLIEKRLLTPRMYGDRSGVRLKPYFRLTSLGLSLCVFIVAYDTNR